MVNFSINEVLLVQFRSWVRLHLVKFSHGLAGTLGRSPPRRGGWKRRHLRGWTVNDRTHRLGWFFRFDSARLKIFFHVGLTEKDRKKTRCNIVTLCVGRGETRRTGLASNSPCFVGIRNLIGIPALDHGTCRSLIRAEARWIITRIPNHLGDKSSSAVNK